MIYLLYLHFHTEFHRLNLFRYLTVRTAFASLTALALALLLGPATIRWLRRLQIGQYIREEGPQSHQAKAGTPTMGGVLITICVLLPTLLWADLSNVFVWLALLVTLAFAGIGFWDDYQKVVKRRNLGLTGRSKMLLQILVSFCFGMALMLLSAVGRYSTDLTFPFVKAIHPSFLIRSLLHNPFTFPLAFLPFLVFVVFLLVGSSNAVNLTDGLDGLAIGCVIISASALTALTYVVGNAAWAGYLDVEHLPGVAELTPFCGAMVGASLGFLWYNAYPAEIFMGDVGSLSLGGSIACVAVMIKQELLLPFIGGIFVLEALSVMLQVAWFKSTGGRRIFRMAPLHHHFELEGWKESKIIARFWIVALVFSLFALATLKIR
ncbi:MAG TPA: phospho-N-acetylmuramoyl-pentapeptide-transferase [Terriglobia bacterium]|jgi:phospho-N-acetylmuramoyl-pentapeptide-transferase|nr:phospho-N-acetylmuramoyl-pentapeptide-transferase [Terriglobia bacterium]